MRRSGTVPLLEPGQQLSLSRSLRLSLGSFSFELRDDSIQRSQSAQPFLGSRGGTDVLRRVLARPADDRAGAPASVEGDRQAVAPVGQIGVADLRRGGVIVVKDSGSSLSRALAWCHTPAYVNCG